MGTVEQKAGFPSVVQRTTPTVMKSFDGDTRVEVGRKTAALRVRQRQRQESRRWSPSGRLRTPASREIGGLLKKETIPWNDRFMFDDESEHNNITNSRSSRRKPRSGMENMTNVGSPRVDCHFVETRSVGVSTISTANESATINTTMRPNEMETVLDRFEELILTMEMEEALVRRELEIKKNVGKCNMNKHKMSPEMSIKKNEDKDAKAREMENRNKNNDNENTCYYNETENVN